MTGAAHRLPEAAEVTPELRDYQRAIRTGEPEEYRYVTLLGLTRLDPLGLAREVERGLPYRAFERFLRNSALTREELALAVNVPLRTLHRRRAQGRLGRDESDRLVRVTRIFARALELFEGNRDSARRWLSTPLAALRRESPLNVARTEVGSREVEYLIGRLEHGVTS
jgi:putative toxin-antitoxin system antitoxin component (TIGR02293 family)